MLTRLTLYRPGWPPEGKIVDLPEDPGFDLLDQTLRPLLDGANLEHVLVLYDCRRADMFVDELGALTGLPLNRMATAIYRAASLKNDPDLDPSSLPAIHGPAVVFDRIVWR